MCVRVCVCVCVRACVLACMGVCVRVRASARAEEVRSDGDLVLCFVTGYVFQFGETVLSKKENITTIYLLYLGHNGCTLIIKYYMSGIYNNMINTNS